MIMAYYHMTMILCKLKGWGLVMANRSGIGRKSGSSTNTPQSPNPP